MIRPNGSTRDTVAEGAVSVPSTRADLVPVEMREAVGYPRIDCRGVRSVEGAIVLKHDRLFLLTDRHGDIMPPGQCTLGLFLDDTRILSHYALRISGGPPALLSAQVLRPYASQIDLAVSDAIFGGSAWDPKHAVHVRREVVLDDQFLERLTLENHLLEPVDYWVELAIGCDFADIFEVRGWRRERRGQFYAPRVENGEVIFAYRGVDGRLLRTRFCLEQPPTAIDGRGFRWEFRLATGAQHVLTWALRAEEETAATPVRVPAPPTVARDQVETRRAELRETYSRWRTECSRWKSDVSVFDDTVGRAIDDLYALYISADGGRVISAGIPWYSTVFGRDSIITGLETLALHPGIAVDTLRYLGRRQGEREDPRTEEQPGKILHELRRGEMARSGEIPHVPYFGTVDATPLWIILLHETWRWTGNDDLVPELLPNLRRALAWIDDYGDPDGDGFVEYHCTSRDGLHNQGWKDSSDGVPFPDGRLPEPPIALVEVQGYVYDAKRRAAELLARYGAPGEAEPVRAAAERLRARIQEAFWMEEMGTFALALDRHKRQVPTVTSNAGHLLWNRVPTPEQAARVVATLLDRDMFSGWGIRTLSARHPVFNPMSYHNGSIWPHDNALIVLGMAQYDMAARALPVVDVLQESAAQIEFQRVPELYCGMRRASGMRPVLYPVSCSPQAWASGAIFLMLQAVLGIFPEGSKGLLHIRNPVLPGFLHDLTITGLPAGRSRVSLRFARHRDRTLVNLLEVEGDPIQVRIELG
ncbi:MAG TPA: glycogen debranching N-terminal domain-containing protein [Gemmatimonadaceae bacterium]|nr:glycogen debranching N-terminal domain-containing protein [Gemmatimonadaceae bacterium]